MMTGRITRLIDTQQVGSIAGDDGHEYVFSSGSLSGVAFHTLALGARVSFDPGAVLRGEARANSVRLITT